MYLKQLKYRDPCSVYQKLYRLNSVLLESQKNARYSYIALNPYIIFKSKGRKIEIIERGNRTIKSGNPIVALKKIIKARDVVRQEGLPLFCSGAIGYFGYDIVHFFEKLPSGAKDDLGLPDIYLIFPKDILFFDHKKKIMKIMCRDKADIGRIIKRINSKVGSLVRGDDLDKVKFKSNFTRSKYKKAVEKCKEYVRAGDSFQIKISQRFECKIDEDPFEIYKRLRKINPSPYAAFLHFDDCTLVSCSPEHLVKVEDGNVETRPIGGTYPRGKSSREDITIAKRFMKDEKERAEHTMLIDLERNDLGRVCRYGSIHVNEMMSLEKYSHLMHIVTNIKGKLQEGKDVFDVLRAMFPGGTITGCPKVRTMEIIDEIEPTARGPYTGSIGFLNFSNEMDLNLTIRTLVIKDGRGYIQVGGGIVADSNAKREYEETVHKAMALLEAIGKK